MKTFLVGVKCLAVIPYGEGIERGGKGAPITWEGSVTLLQCQGFFLCLMNDTLVCTDILPVRKGKRARVRTCTSIAPQTPHSMSYATSAAAHRVE